MQQTVVTKSGVSVESPYTDQEAMQKLKDLVDNGSLSAKFPSDLVRRSLEGRGLSDEQVVWAHVLVVQFETKAKVPKRPALQLPRVVALLRGARRNGHKWPKVTATGWWAEGDATTGYDADDIVKLSLTGEGSKYPETINIVNGGKYGEEGARWYGRIYGDGLFEPAPQCTDQVVEMLMRMEKAEDLLAEFTTRSWQKYDNNNSNK